MIVVVDPDAAAAARRAAAERLADRPAERVVVWVGEEDDPGLEELRSELGRRS